MVVGIIHGGSIALTEKGQRELSWAARMRRRPGMSQETNYYGIHRKINHHLYVLTLAV
jgi:hypothetical protein